VPTSMYQPSLWRVGVSIADWKVALSVYAVSTLLAWCSPHAGLSRSDKFGISAAYTSCSVYRVGAAALLGVQTHHSANSTVDGKTWDGAGNIDRILVQPDWSRR
jgi:hypothetical protein